MPDEKEDMLEVVNEKDIVIGLESRKMVHQKGLLHREIHIWFMTPNREIIFQHRAKDKDMFPDKLDATVGGHVDKNMSYEETAIKEAKEETGINIDPSKLKLVRKIFRRFVDKPTGLINNAIQTEYAYLFDGNINDLKVETDKAIGFEAWKIDSLHNLAQSDQQKFLPFIFSNEMLDLFDYGQKLLGLK
jgi:isopentenyl-diphosphate Delta-isomerase